MSITGVLVCLPAYGAQVHLGTVETLFNLCAWFMNNRIPNACMTAATSDIIGSRNLMLTTFYDGFPQFSHMLFVDSDMRFHPSLVGDLLGLDEPLCGALYRKKVLADELVMRPLPKGQEPRTKPGFIEVAGIGCGAMLISRDLISTMLEQMPHLCKQPAGESRNNWLIRAFNTMDDDQKVGHGLSEDLSFCERWRQCGGTIWAATDHEIGHFGMKNYICVPSEILKNGPPQ